MIFTALLHQATVAQKPNIVYIMADDLGYGEVGCYGQEKIPTPNIDRLAAEGVKFTQGYASSPVCAPSRASLLTGKNQGHAVIRGNKEQGDFSPNGVEGQFPMPASEKTIAELLKENGYRTGIVGKWGLGGPNPGETPMDHGFDRFYGYLCQRRSHTFYPPYLWSNHQPDLLDNPVYNAHQKIDAALPSEDDYYARYGGKTYSATRLMEECRAFIAGSKGGPFFLYYAPTLPHVALQAPREWVDKFPKSWDDKPYLGQGGYLPNARPRATYAAMIAYLDFTVGAVLQELQKQGVDRNTLVIFTSDNGAAFNGGVDRPFFRSNGPLRDGKMSLYEGGIRVPFVARWPGVVAPGRTVDVPIVSFDSYATLAEVAGLRPGRTDGRSYRPALLGQQMPEREELYFEYPEANSQQAVIFEGRWKVIRPNLKSKPNLIEVYDLRRDIGEQNDLSSTRPDLVKRGLEAMKRSHRRNTDFPLPGVDGMASAKN